MNKSPLWKKYIFVFLMSISTLSFAQTNAITNPIPLSELSSYKTQPETIKNLISIASQLSKMHLTYLFGSADPKNKGMDCSGIIYYLLNQTKLNNVPRQSDELFNWVDKKGKLYRVTSNDFDSSQFSKLKVGDLLFWSGTYATHRSSPISHVMLYLGKDKSGEPLMFGSSDGRTYQGKRMRGVSVFDFVLPDGRGPQRFVGYGCIPDLTCEKKSN